MSDQAVHYPGPALTGERVSISSPMRARHRNTGRAWLDWSRRLRACGPALFLCGAITLWAAPALLLVSYSPQVLFEALARAPLRGRADDLLSLLGGSIYAVAVGLLVGTAGARLGRQLRSARAMLLILSAPLVVVSIIATLVTAIPLFVGMILLCWPHLV